MAADDAMDTGSSGGTYGNVRKEDVLALMDQKKKVEDELGELYAVLQSQGADMDSPLVDAQGYPRSDVDVYQVRHARSKINRLRNDLKALMDRIESGLHNLHAQSREGVGANSPDDLASGGASASDRTPTPECFARVDVVSPSSPAESAGLEVGDRLAEFGSISATNFTNLKSIGEMVQNSVGRVISVTVVRGEADRVKKLKLTPQEWSGRGLLGCNIVPVEPAVDR